MKTLIAAILVALQSLNNPPVEQRKLLTAVTDVIEQRHYLQPVIDDQFSEGVWGSYLHSLDTRKNIFLQADIQLLKKYQHSLDNEMHGDSIQFFPAVTTLFAKRYQETAIIYRQLLSRPFTFSNKDSLFPGQEPAAYPKNEEERLRRWNSYLKQSVFEKLTTLRGQRAQSKPGDATWHKTDGQLEQMARANLLKQNDRIQARYLANDTQKLFSSYLNTIARYTDPHSDYFPPLDKQAFDQFMANRFFGIGAGLKENEEGHIIITALDAGGPAWKSNAFTVNDQVIKVGQGSSGPLTEVEGMSVSEVVRLIRGDKGSTVRICCRKAGGAIITIPLIREEIRQEEAGVRSAVITKDNSKVGYIYLPAFYDDFAHADGAHCADDVERELNKLKAENISSLIIDLRNDGGGSLTQVVKMVGLFIGNGPVVQVKAGKGAPQALISYRPAPLYTGPLTVIVNEFSASASEIFAAAIQDYKRGLIIGSATFGKGTVQTELSLGQEEYGALKLTIQKFYRVNGGSTQQKGVIPDIVLPDNYETAGIREGDMPFALDWDRIQPADYNAKSNINIDLIATQAQERIDKDSVFKTIRRYNTSLENDQEERKQGILLQNFSDQLKQKSTIARQLEVLAQLPEKAKMQVQGITGAKNQKWLESVAKDIYIEQAVKTTMDIK